MSIAKKILLLLPIFFIATACNNARRASGRDYTTPLIIGEKKIFVEIADTSEKKARGLSGREKLKNDEGMLFDFRSDYPLGGSPGFWMNEMKFDLDLIWIKSNPPKESGRIVGITENVPAPESLTDKLPIYSPPSPINIVLEVNAGWSERYNIKIGDEIQWE